MMSCCGSQQRRHPTPLPHQPLAPLWQTTPALVRQVRFSLRQAPAVLVIRTPPDIRFCARLLTLSAKENGLQERFQQPVFTFNGTSRVTALVWRSAFQQFQQECRGPFQDHEKEAEEYPPAARSRSGQIQCPKQPAIKGVPAGYRHAIEEFIAWYCPNRGFRSTRQ